MYEKSTPSDVDVVILVDKNTKKWLYENSDKVGMYKDVKHKEAPLHTQLDHEPVSVHFGKVNFVVCTDPVEFEGWRQGTIACIAAARMNGSLTREQSIAIVEKARELHHLIAGSKNDSKSEE